MTRTPSGIRAYLVSILTGATPAGDRVYNARLVDYDTDELPVITVASAGGSENNFGVRGFLASRTDRVRAVGAVTVTTASDQDLAEAVDAMESAILDCVMGDPDFRAWESIRVTVEKTVDLSTRRRVGGVSVTWELEHKMVYTSADAGLPLESIAITTEALDPAGAAVSERVIELDQEEA